MPVAEAVDWNRRKAAWREGLLSPLWESNAHAPTPGARSGNCWRWRDVQRCALEAAELTSPEIVERRVLRLVNPDPSSATDESTVGNLAAAIQILLPGESARPHRHSIHALRFVLQGSGATTIVNGKPVAMHVGDMLLTPGNCWHEHAHTGNEPMLWLDALDAPLHGSLGVSTFQRGPAVDVPTTIAQGAFSSANIVPTLAKHEQPYSPVFRYPYKDAVAALEHTPIGRSGARSVRYINPLTGGAPLPTIDCEVVGLLPGKQTVDYRSNANVVCLVVEGEGESRVHDRSFTWSKYDILTVPQGSWVRHLSREGARLFQLSDREMLRRLDLFLESYRE